MSRWKTDYTSLPKGWATQRGGWVVLSPGEPGLDWPCPPWICGLGGIDIGISIGGGGNGGGGGTVSGTTLPHPAPPLGGERLGIPNHLSLPRATLLSLIIPSMPQCEFGPCLPIGSDFLAGISGNGTPGAPWTFYVEVWRQFPVASAGHNRTPWYKNSCVTSALGEGALSVGVDAIGLIPEGGGAKTVARSLGNWVGYRGIVADQFGKAAIQQVKGGADTLSLTQGLGGQDWISTGLSVAGFVPVLGQFAAGASIIYDGYKTWKKIKACP